MVRVAINGFGRIGRLTLRAWLEKGVPEIDIVAVNDLTDAPMLAHLFRFDSVHGTLPWEVVPEDDGFRVNGRRIRVLAERDPAKLPWRELGVEVVVESTGRFTNREDAAKHLEAGAKKVIISAPAKETTSRSSWA